MHSKMIVFPFVARDGIPRVRRDGISPNRRQRLAAPRLEWEWHFLLLVALVPSAVVLVSILFGDRA